MGGKSFKQPATRLTTAQLDILTTYCQHRLADIFPAIERLRFVRSKTSHGDLDLLCAEDGISFEFRHVDVGMSHTDEPSSPLSTATGMLRGGTTAGSDTEGLVEKQRDGESDEAGVNAGTQTPRDESAQETTDALMLSNRDSCWLFCDTVAQALPAKGWMLAFFGYPIIALQLPCRVCPSAPAPLPQDDQVDLALAPLASFDAYLFSCSYNIPFAILVLACQTLSPSIWLKRDALCVRHRPFANLPYIEVELTKDREAIYRWFGLDIARWAEGFEDYEEIYLWITTVSLDGCLGRAWNRVAAGQMDRRKLHYRRWHTREDGVPEFVAWLKANWSVSRRTEQASEACIAFGNLHLSVGEVDPGLTGVNGRVAQIPLDEEGVALLEAWGKVDEYASLVDQRRVEAEKIAESQARRILNRAKAIEEGKRRAERHA